MKLCHSQWAALAVFVVLSAFPPMGLACTGDCNGDGEVTIDELVSMVNIALGTLPLDSCQRGDANGDGEVTIDEIIQAVNFALVGCPSGCTQATIRLALEFDPNSVVDLAGLSLRIPYSTASLSLPEEPSTRVRDLSDAGGFFDVQLVPGTDPQYERELRISYLTPATIPPGSFLEIVADCVAGSTPTPDALRCLVTDTSDSGGFPLEGEVRCSLDIRVD